MPQNDSPQALTVNDIHANIKMAFDYSKKNHEYFKQTKRFVFEKSLTDADKKTLEGQNKNQLTANILEPILNQNLRNVRDSYPECNYISKDDSIDGQLQADRLNQKLEEIYEDSNYEHAMYSVAENAFAGGEGIFKIKTEYLNNMTFDQRYVIESVDEPTYILFDPTAKTATKEDAEYVTELTPMGEDAFKRLYPGVDIEKLSTAEDVGFSWVTLNTTHNRKTIIVATYWYLKYTKTTIYLLNDGAIVAIEEGSKTQKPDKKLIEDQRDVYKSKLYMQRICGNEVLEEEKETCFKGINFIDVPGKVVKNDGQVKNLAYLHNAIDAQRAKNFMMQEFIDRSLNARDAMVVIADQTLTTDTIKNLTDPTRRQLVIYNALVTNEAGETTVMPPPTVIPPQPISPEHVAFFERLDDAIQKILGSYSMSLDEKNLSGKALYNMSAYINDSNEPFMYHLELASVRIGQLILDSMPDLCSTEFFDQIHPDTGQELENVQEDYNFSPEKFSVRPMRSVNTRLQAEATNEQLAELMQTSPAFAAFMNQSGLSFILENMDLKNKDKIIEQFTLFMDQNKAQPPQPNAQFINAQANMLKAQTQQQKLQADAQSDAASNAVDMQRIQSDQQINQTNAAVQLKQINSENLRHVLTTLHSHDY